MSREGQAKKTFPLGSQEEEPKFRRTLPPAHNSMKRKVHRWVWGRRCSYCKGGIIILYWPRGREHSWIPIEPASWDGSAYYVRGVHRFHGRRCEFWRQKPKFINFDPDTFI